MSTNAKRAIVALIGGLGFVFLLIGAIGHVYATTTYRSYYYVCLLVSRRCTSTILGTEKREILGSHIHSGMKQVQV